MYFFEILALLALASLSAAKPIALEERTPDFCKAIDVAIAVDLLKANNADSFCTSFLNVQTFTSLTTVIPTTTVVVTTDTITSMSTITRYTHFFPIANPLRSTSTMHTTSYMLMVCTSNDLEQSQSTSTKS